MVKFPEPKIGEPVVRRRTVLGAILGASALLGGRLVWVQGVDPSTLAAEAVSQRTRTTTLLARRGEITDREGGTLAISVERYDIWANQLQVPDYLARDLERGKVSVAGVEAAASALAPVLGLTVAEAREALTGENQFTYLARTMTPAARDAVMSLDVPGIGADRVADRVYPNGAVAGNIVGFVGADGTALAGLELQLDEHLRGSNGERKYERGADGRTIPTGQGETVHAVDGQTVVTTIDRDIQYYAQNATARRVEEFGARGASAVVMDPTTGEILAMVDVPTYDPNDPSAVPDTQRGNASVSSVFEPGSTGKIFTMAAILDSGALDLSAQFTVPSVEHFGDQRVKDARDYGTRKFTLSGILAESSNVGIVMAAESVDPEVRLDYLKRFGMGKKTGITLPGESAGILHEPEDWDGRTAINMAFGQGYSGTALQMVNGFATICNRGVPHIPSIVKEYIAPDGTVTPASGEVGEPAVSPETAQQLLALLDNDVHDDGVTGGSVPGYTVGGKSGTAEESSPEGGLSGNYTSSFIAVAPAEDPKLVVGVFVYGIDSFLSGSRVAGPVVSDLMSFSLQTLGIPPTGAAGVELPSTWE